MLNYIITVAISAFFVPHYLSIFWAPLRTNPWDIIGGAAVILILVAINIVGIKEAARLNVVLAVVDFATQLLLVIIGFAIVFHPHVLTANVHWGVAPTWGAFALAIPVAMIAYTGIETVSNLAEEARDPSRSIPASIRLVAIAVFAIYFTLPLVALSALPVYKDVGRRLRDEARPPAGEGRLRERPGARPRRATSACTAGCSARGKIYVGILAATILFIATNAGVIGASRITYSMASYRQLPEVFRRLHPRFKTPWLSLLVFAGVIPIAVLLPGKVDFLGTMYSFGAMLSFTIAHASIIALRREAGRGGSSSAPAPTCGSAGSTSRSSPSSAGSAPRSPGSSSSSSTRRRAGRGSPGWRSGSSSTGSTAAGSSTAALRETVRAPVLVLGPSLTVEYRTIVVPVKRTGESEEALVAAAPARGRARRDGRDRPRDRGAARAAARREAARRGGRGRDAARRRAGARRELRRPGGHAPRSARAAPGRRSSRRRGAATPSSSFSARRAAPSRAAAGSSAAPSTTSSARRRAACSSPPGREWHETERHRADLGAPRRPRRRRDRTHRAGGRRRRARARSSARCSSRPARSASGW